MLHWVQSYALKYSGFYKDYLNRWNIYYNEHKGYSIPDDFTSDPGSEAGRDMYLLPCQSQKHKPIVGPCELIYEEEGKKVVDKIAIYVLSKDSKYRLCMTWDIECK